MKMDGATIREVVENVVSGLGLTPGRMMASNSRLSMATPRTAVAPWLHGQLLAGSMATPSLAMTPLTSGRSVSSTSIRSSSDVAECWSLGTDFLAPETSC